MFPIMFFIRKVTIIFHQNFNFFDRKFRVKRMVYFLVPNLIFDPNFDPNYDPNFDANFGPKFDPNFDTKFGSKFWPESWTQILTKNFDQILTGNSVSKKNFIFGPNLIFDPNFDPTYDPKFWSKFRPKFWPEIAC